MMKNNYSVYFEIYGKKMKSKVLADSVEDAKQQVIDKIVFHKIVSDDDDERAGILGMLNNIVNGK